jgi:hypothetical protein
MMRVYRLDQPALPLLTALSGYNNNLVSFATLFAAENWLQAFRLKGGKKFR